MYKKSFIFSFILLIIFSYSNIFAHSGRTDSNGGHKDNKNVSGLGNYHYHCGGYPAHLHENRICPYSSNSNLINTNNTSNQQDKNLNTVPIEIAVDNIFFKDTQCTIEMGKQIKPIYVIEPNNATDKTVKFSTNNTNVLEINENGAINGKNVGSASYVVTTNNGKSATLLVTIVRYPESIKININENKEYNVGETLNLNCEVLPKDASSNITWSSNNNNIATVDYTGKVTCLSSGEVTITAKDVKGKSDSVKLKIIQKEEETISLIPLLLFEGIIGAVIPLVLRKKSKGIK